MIESPEAFPKAFHRAVAEANEQRQELRLYCATHPASALEVGDPTGDHTTLRCPEADCPTAVVAVVETLL